MWFFLGTFATEVLKNAPICFTMFVCLSICNNMIINEEDFHVT
jgi:hypothetical protein